MSAALPSLVPEHVHPLVKIALLPLTLPLAVLFLVGAAVEEAVKALARAARGETK